MNRRVLRLVGTWGPLVALGLITSILLLGMWASDDTANRQDRNLRTILVVGLSFVLFLAWFAALAPIPGRIRILAVTSVVGLGVAMVALFRIEGVSGDMLPILRFRWGTPPDLEPPKLESGKEATAPPSAAGGTFPQFLGPGRTGIVPALNFSTDWAARAPRVVWRRGVGPAWSGIAVVDGKAVTQEQREGREQVVCYDLASGRQVWAHEDRARYQTTLGGIGPRATPTVSDGSVYALGATGILNCLDLASGDRVWSFVITRNTGAAVPEWGFAGSPLVEGNRVIVQAGGRPGALLAAYDRATGKPLWTAGTGKASYASPTVELLGGRRQIVMLNFASCTGHDLEAGDELWRYEWRGAQPKAAQPVGVGDGRVVISAGYGVGADAFRVVSAGDGPWSVEPLWKSLHLKAKFSTFVHRAGHLYGLNDGVLVCIDVETGRRVWRGERYGHGQLLLSGGRLILLSEEGEIVLVDAEPAEFRERGRFAVFEDKTWNTPALAGRYLLVRNDREMACVELPLEE